MNPSRIPCAYTTFRVLLLVALSLTVMRGQSLSDTTERPLAEEEHAPIASRSRILLGIGSAMVSGGVANSPMEFSAGFAFETVDPSMAAVGLVVQRYPFKSTFDLKPVLDGGLTTVGIEGTLRWYRTPAFTFMGHYLGLGAGLHLLFWSYTVERNLPTYDEEGNQTGTDWVKHDANIGLDLHGAVGLDLAQLLPVALEGEIRPGVFFVSPHTFGKFKNELIEAQLYLKLRVSLRIALPE